MANKPKWRSLPFTDRGMQRCQTITVCRSKHVICSECFYRGIHIVRSQGTPRYVNWSNLMWRIFSRYYSTLYCIVLHCTTLHCIVLHCTALRRTALHCAVLYCTALYCTTSYASSLLRNVHSSFGMICTV